ncbi:MAG: glycosyltransferase [Ardenticatenaceae bacterium]|nr:glycosyltransferase [Ardenticatenaceae bacterium]
MISVIIPAHNAAHTITDCLTALQQQTAVPDTYEIIVVDDGSTDNTGELATNAGATVIRQAKSGPAAARNAGIQAANGEITCFTDADCVPAPTWIAAITEPLRQDPDIAASKGTYCTRQREIAARFVQLEYEDKYDRLKAYARITFMDFYSAACRRQVLLDNEGFDERFPNSEDRELSYRLAARGYQMVFQPTALVCHHHSHTIADYFRKKIMNGYWTAQAVRHFPERTVEDSYTPQVMKIQIGLMALVMATAVSGILLPPLLLLCGLVACAFVATTLPFTAKAWKKDKLVALCAPSLLALRALALGIGYAWGLLRPIADPTA